LRFLFFRFLKKSQLEKKTKKKFRTKIGRLTDQTGRVTDFYRFARFSPGSLAGRFTATTRPNVGPVPRSTGPTGRSGSNNLGL
jgi:hypothetical protein